MLEILLVDDERSEREGISYLIKKYKLPLNISEAPNGKKALEHIQSNRVDILLTDVEMPHMDGLELAKKTCKYNRD
ncbi:MAG: response regulator, partial [Peptostreptococcaceae bacterium]